MKETENATPVGTQVPNVRERQVSDSVSCGGQIPVLAREAVEIFVLRRRIVEPKPYSPSSLLSRRSACFVCIKTHGRELRGCIGTIEAEKSTLAEEIVANAVKAATRDPRFRPVSENELPGLRYSVDILESPEPARFEDLDPAVFGVVVVDNSGTRRGLLLPGIESIDTPELQVRIAAKKAGLKPDDSLKLYRFRTHRFSEWDDLKS